MIDSALQALLDRAIAHHNAGQLSQAEALYRHILAACPNHSQSLHLLGVIAYQVGQHESAIALIREALAFDDSNPFAHYDLGNALKSAGRLTEAAIEYGHAIDLKSDYAAAYHNLGAVYKDQGRIDDAILAYQRALKNEPNLVFGYYNLGNAYRMRKQLNEAAAAYRQAIALRPDYAEAHNNLGVTLKELGLFDEAISALRQVIALTPNHAEAHSNLGDAYRARNLFSEAIASCQKAISLKPQFPEAFNNLGIAYKESGMLNEAIAAFHRALAIRPDIADIYNNLGNVLAKLNQIDHAIAAFRKAIALAPSYAAAHNNLGNTLRIQGHFSEAAEMIYRANQLNPDSPEILNNLGNLYKDRGELEAAVAAYCHSLKIRPDQSVTLQNLLYTLLFRPDCNQKMIVEEQKRLESLLRASCHPPQGAHENQRDTDRPLKIGYVSPDFRDHVIGRNMLPLLKHHNLEYFQAICYSDARSSDRITEEICAASTRWRNTAGTTDLALARLIQADSIDILVDLTQHMGGNRLAAFISVSAPLQLSFAGYPESTGLEEIGYRISDKWLEEGGSLQSNGTVVKINGYEQVYLIDSFWCYNPCGIEVPVNELPVQTAGTITFGSLNNFCKVNEPLLKLWARVLTGIKDSRLVVLSHEGSHRQRTLEFLEAEGVDPQRVEFVTPRPRKEYMELYHRLDIVLDTFPYNGHTTSLDALWMGVPVVSLCGERPVSRAGLSQLSNLGLPELVAFTEDHYVEIAAKLATDIPRLKELRATLRQRMEKSVLMDGPHFARQIEACYRSMWRQWCESQNS
jgi:predicted O-linked N-acetylglucosamine transferase (SPINDLY family)